MIINSQPLKDEQEIDDSQRGARRNQRPDLVPQMHEQRFDLLGALLPEWPSELNAWA